MRELPIKHNPSVVEPVLEKVLEWISKTEEEGGLGGAERLGGVGMSILSTFLIVITGPSYEAISRSLIRRLRNAQISLKIDSNTLPGYCFGARFIIRLLSRNLLAAGVINHPSFQTREEVRSLVGFPRRSSRPRQTRSSPRTRGGRWRIS